MKNALELGNKNDALYRPHCPQACEPQADVSGDWYDVGEFGEIRPVLAFRLEQHDDGSLGGEIEIIDLMPVNGQVCGDQVWFTTPEFEVDGVQHRITYAGIVDQTAERLHLSIALLHDNQITQMDTIEVGRRGSVLFQEDFDGQSDASIRALGWEWEEPVADTPNWYVSAAAERMQFQVLTPAFGGSSLLVSPQIDASSTTAKVELRVSHILNYGLGGSYPGSGSHTLSVRVSTDNGATWAVVWLLEDNQASIPYSPLIVDLSAYAGQTFKLAWRFEGSDSEYTTWSLDDIWVTGY